jgi:hypothetical protein
MQPAWLSRRAEAIHSHRGYESKETPLKTSTCLIAVSPTMSVVIFSWRATGFGVVVKLESTGQTGSFWFVYNFKPEDSEGGRYCYDEDLRGP